MRLFNFYNNVYPVICLLACLLLPLSSFTMVAQQTKQLPVTLTWTNAPQKIPGFDFTELGVSTVKFNGAAYNWEQHALPIFSHKVKLSSGNVTNLSVNLENLIWESFDASNIPSINEYTAPDIVVETSIAYEKKEAYALISFIPIKQAGFGGEYQRLLSGQIKIKYVEDNNSNNTLTKGNRTYTNNSVLNQGDFYKFQIAETGIYQIDYDFLVELGISESINLNNIRIYGNGGAMLPELAGAEKYDDLVENPIQVVDQNNNGTFEQGDYLLFYAQGADTWDYLSTADRFQLRNNIYTDYAYYFLNYDIGLGKRVANAPQPNSYNYEASTFLDAQYVNDDFYQLIRSGRKWYGDLFGLENQHTYSFNFPNLVEGSTVRVFGEMAARYITGSSSSSSFTISSNGEVLTNVNISSLIANDNLDYSQQHANSNFFNTNFTTNSDNIDINIVYNRPTSTAEGWLDYLEVNARRSLIFNDAQMPFAEPNTLGESRVTKFTLASSNNNVQVWNVTNIDNVQNLVLTNEAGGLNNIFTFIVPTSGELQRFIAFDTNPNSYYTPTAAMGLVPSQNLHAESFYDMLIVTHTNFLEAANELAAYRTTKNNYSVLVATTEQIYNEFGSGAPDLSAIRDFVKMFYDRAEGNTDLMPKCLLLFGDASYDYKNILFSEEDNHNFVPTFESYESLTRSRSFCTDDYLGFLDDNEGENITDNNDLLDIGIGRLPIRTLEEGYDVVNKIKTYESAASLGSWRNEFTLIADDEDGNIHLQDAEVHAKNLESNGTKFNIDKIYLDAYQQISTSGGSRYPDVNTALSNKIFNGTLVVNYAGHGGENGWAHERILKIEDMLQWSNINQLPLFVTATCSFTRYDDPDKHSAGEILCLQANGGAIALMTTVRLVYASYNEALNTAFLNSFLAAKSATDKPNLGEIARMSKNNAVQSTSTENTRKFVLMGDPAISINFPEYDMAITEINDQPVSEFADTLKALSKVNITGEVRGNDGSRMTDFNGTAYATIFDKTATVTTLGQDSGSGVTDFYLDKNIIFKGRASVNAGEFNLEFIVPKDIAYNVDTGRISLYAENGVYDASGYLEATKIGAINENATTDNQGPQVQVFMNDENFVFGGITDENPVLFVKLKDENGLSTVGNGIGHDIVGTLDEDTQNDIALNQYYEAAIDNYQEGTIEYPLSDLAVGWHIVSVKAWDVYNNSGTGYTEFVVSESAQMALQEVLNYPNPFVNNTNFVFEHNRPGEGLTIDIQIVALSGRAVKHLHHYIAPEENTGFRVNDIQWDGLDENGNQIVEGTYVYKLQVRTDNNEIAYEIQKLVVLK